MDEILFGQGMDFSLDKIKDDLKKLSEKEFLIKYILKSDNWYFSEYQKQSDVYAIGQMESLKEILNKQIGVAFHNVLMVGSGKIGCSLAPKKNWKKFDEENDSDIDIALISSKLFECMWEKIRIEYNQNYISRYTTIASSVFRGFINENNFRGVDAVRPFWNKQIDEANKEIQNKLSVYHTINYRIYRSWEDLEAYHINGLRKLKQEVNYTDYGIDI